MRDERYGVAANIAVLVAVASALLFDHSGAFRPVVAAAGVLAALISATAYFRFHWTEGAKQGAMVSTETPSLSLEEQTSGLTEKKGPSVTPIGKFYGGNVVSDYMIFFDAIDTSPEANIVNIAWHNKNIVWHSEHPLSVRNAIWSECRVFHQAQESASSTFTDQVVEIVNRLAPTCEFELTKDGNLQIHPKLSRLPLAEEFDEIDRETDMNRSPDRPKTVN